MQVVIYRKLLNFTDSIHLERTMVIMVLPGLRQWYMAKAGRICLPGKPAYCLKSVMLRNPQSKANETDEKRTTDRVVSLVEQ